MKDAMLLPLGEVIAWMSKATTQTQLVHGLTVAGLDASLARDLLPRYAFSRALRKMEENRVIRQISEDNTHITFQFTKEAKVHDKFEYSIEAKLTLRKSDGHIVVDNTHSSPRECEALRTLAVSMLDAAMVNRTASDVTSIVQRVLKGRGDLFPINPNGGAYFVPQAHAGLIDQVQKFLGEIGGAVNRFAVAQGNAETARSVRDSIADGIRSAIAEYKAAVEAFDMDTRPDTILRAAERIKAAEFKVKGYDALLGDHRDALNAEFAALKGELRTKVKSLGKSKTLEAADKVTGGGGADPAPLPKTSPAIVAARTPAASIPITIG